MEELSLRLSRHSDCLVKKGGLQRVPEPQRYGNSRPTDSTWCWGVQAAPDSSLLDTAVNKMRIKTRK
ncbi:hypothetical protein Bpfe_014798 [Biomphalaria pfeifferi]|uniref:Uncharacterized protein n=1 Tax=Biomphalaria pfeifferi TaxID=112525 RepID=A0AAD8BKA8_BIOPF|nr:hypothetical protein Bpfe_014798 [Biomphalaria pfeifferi]